VGRLPGHTDKLFRPSFNLALLFIVKISSRRDVWFLYGRIISRVAARNFEGVEGAPGRRIETEAPNSIRFG